MKTTFPNVCILGALLITSVGCAKEVYYDYEGPQISLFKVSTLKPGAMCAQGGQTVEYGNDINGNGALDRREIISTKYVCNGAVGGGAIVNVVEDPETPACTYGGTRLELGVDANRDGVLVGDEIHEIHYVCDDARRNNWNQIEALAATDDFTCGKLRNASVACWGASPNGSDQASTPVIVSGLSKAVAISPGCALSALGNVECWTGLDDSPRRVPNLQDVTAIAGTPAKHACAIFGEHSGIKCWGANDKGQLGNGTTDRSSTPVEVFDASGNRLQSAKAIAVGEQHTCAIVGDRHEVWCWGSNERGQLGAASDDPLSVGAAKVLDEKNEALINAISIAAGDEHSCAVLQGIGVRCWGGNTSGQLGSKIALDSLSNKAIAVLDGKTDMKTAQEVSLGIGFSCVRHSTGEVKCWGDNSLGQLGDRTQSFNSTVPVTVQLASGEAPLRNALSIAAGGGHVCAVIRRNLDGIQAEDPSLKTKEVMCWGRSSRGQMGNSFRQTYEERALLPVSTDIANTQPIVSGADHNCRRNMDSSVSCWGLNEGGQLGSDKGTRWLFSDLALDVLAPEIPESASSTGNTPRPTLTSVQDIFASPVAHHTCALKADGSLACWGRNGSGQLGDGEKTYWKLPVQVPAIESNTVVSAAVGALHTCAQLNSGSVACWGDNKHGQLTTSVEESLTPITVSGISVSGVANGIAAGSDFTCAINSSAKNIRCWGDGSEGQLGRGSKTSSTTPQAAGSINGVTRLKAGHRHVCAQLATGDLWCWGNNAYGQLGRNSTNEGLSPAKVTAFGTTPSSVVVQDFCLGHNHTCAVLSDKTAWCWGNNVYGQLGLGTYSISQTTPARIGNLTDVESIQCGMAHTCAKMSNGEYKCWGRNNYAQIGESAGQMGATSAAIMP